MRNHAPPTGDRVPPATERTEGAASSSHPLLALQAAAGNRAVDALVHSAGSGAPFPTALGAYFGARFGFDFGGVRVHRGADAERAASAAGAAAFTVGSHVVFGRGRYAPETFHGHRLLAHELAHVVQQRPGAEAGGEAETPALEAAADRAAREAVSGTGRVAVRGRARAGMAREPDSLRSTPDVRSMSEAAIRTEIGEIRAWLAAQGTVSTPDTEHLKEMLRRLEERLVLLGSGMAPWADFAPLFNAEFAATLHVFAVPGAPVAAGARPAGATGDALTPARLKALFTAGQRDKLKDFISSRRIPEWLFNGADQGTTTAQQRLLLSAHILANGTYRPGSFDQRVHARMCWHWVQIVHHYAGATPAGGGMAEGVMGSFDPLGKVVLGTGKGIGVWHEKAVKAPDLPAEEEPENLGPLQGKQAEAAEKAAEVDPTKAPSFHRQPALPFDRFNELQAGDWVWYYNANASGGGAHSVIFSHWASGENKTMKTGEMDAAGNEKVARYRVAVVYSQGRPEQGGRRHTALLGDRYAPNEDKKRWWEPVVPITHVSRVGANAAPATTAAEYVPALSTKAATALEKENETFIKGREKALKGTADRGKLREWFRNENANYLAAITPHLAQYQFDLIAEVNTAPDLETLIRLYQRLRALSNNAKILDDNMAAAYEKLDKKHADVTARAAAARTGAETEIATLDADLKAVQEETATGEQRRAELDVDPRIKELQKEWSKLGDRITRAKTAAERETLRKERQAKLDEIAKLREEKKKNAAELGTVRTELKGLATRKKRLETKRTAQIKIRDAKPDLPYGLVHPGGLGKADKGRPTGKLKDIKPGPEWKDLITPAPPAPAKAPAGKKPAGKKP